MEGLGFTKTKHCSAGCYSRCAWVPPRMHFPRRNPLIDAVARTDNPCDRPARCPPSCKPVPKYQPPREKPECHMECYREEQMEAKIREEEGDGDCCQVEMPISEQCQSSSNNGWTLAEINCKTDVLAGFFNPDDNLSPEVRMRRKCDPFWQNCGCGLPPYPCRGVINYPPRKWVHESDYPCDECKGSKYLKPEYLQQQQEHRMKIDQTKMEEAIRKQDEFFQRVGYKPPEPGCPQSLSWSPFCLYDNPNII